MTSSALLNMTKDIFNIWLTSNSIDEKKQCAQWLIKRLSHDVNNDYPSQEEKKEKEIQDLDLDWKPEWEKMFIDATTEYHKAIQLVKEKKSKLRPEYNLLQSELETIYTNSRMMFRQLAREIEESKLLEKKVADFRYPLTFFVRAATIYANCAKLAKTSDENFFDARDSYKYFYQIQDKLQVSTDLKLLKMAIDALTDLQDDFVNNATLYYNTTHLLLFPMVKQYNIVRDQNNSK